jgi:hypothetical protein
MLIVVFYLEFLLEFWCFLKKKNPRKSLIIKSLQGNLRGVGRKRPVIVK